MRNSQAAQAGSLKEASRRSCRNLPCSFGSAPLNADMSWRNIVQSCSSTRRSSSWARRRGYGRAAVRLITAQYPGRWAVAFQDVNTVAARFWTAVTREIDPHAWVEHRGVPGRPDLPADAWAHFTTG